jgi:hypothetical protein
MYGFSAPLQGLEYDTNFHRVLGHDISLLYTHDVKSRQLMWFVVEKMDKQYRMPDIPRYTDEDASALAQRAAEYKINDKDVTFADAWRNRKWARLAPLEEGLLKQWTNGRLICIGDAVHKVSLLLDERDDSLTRESGLPTSAKVATMPSRQRHYLPAFYDAWLTSSQTAPTKPPRWSWRSYRSDVCHGCKLSTRSPTLRHGWKL